MLLERGRTSVDWTIQTVIVEKFKTLNLFSCQYCLSCILHRSTIKHANISLIMCRVSSYAQNTWEKKYQWEKACRHWIDWAWFSFQVAKQHNPIMLEWWLPEYLCIFLIGSYWIPGTTWSISTKIFPIGLYLKYSPSSFFWAHKSKSWLY